MHMTSFSWLIISSSYYSIMADLPFPMNYHKKISWGWIPSSIQDVWLGLNISSPTNWVVMLWIQSLLCPIQHPHAPHCITRLHKMHSKSFSNHRTDLFCPQHCMYATDEIVWKCILNCSVLYIAKAELPTKVEVNDLSLCSTMKQALSRECNSNEDTCTNYNIKLRSSLLSCVGKWICFAASYSTWTWRY